MNETAFIKPAIIAKNLRLFGLYIGNTLVAFLDWQALALERWSLYTQSRIIWVYGALDPAGAIAASSTLTRMHIKTFHDVVAALTLYRR